MRLLVAHKLFEHDQLLDSIKPFAAVAWVRLNSLSFEMTAALALQSDDSHDIVLEQTCPPLDRQMAL